MTRMDAAGGLAVTTNRDVSAALEELTGDDAARRLAAADATLWGEEAAAEAAIRLGWVDTFTRSRALLPVLDELRERLRRDGITKVVLAGMGGSSLAPEVICATLGKPLTVLDSTDPATVGTALADDLASTVVVVSSKSGSTVETESARRAFAQAFTDAGIKNVGDHFVIVTDPGSPLEQLGKAMSATVVTADANVGGRYSALTAFGLVPAALAGVDVTALLDEADTFAATLAAEPPDNPALLLGAAIGGVETMTVASDGSGIVGLGDWIEQLIAESTGKDGKGVLPVVVESPFAAGADADGALRVVVGGASAMTAQSGSRPNPPDVAVHGGLGAQFLAWEAACAFASKVLGVNPFDQPNVAESKDNTARILADGVTETEPAFRQGAVVGYGDGVTDVVSALRLLVDSVPEDGYIAVMAYLDRDGDAATAALRQSLASTTDAPVTFGWGPRFLHSTGQFHKGGRPTGVFLQITADTPDDVEVPGRPYTFGELEAAQAAGDRAALAERGRPVVRLHLTDRIAGITQLLAAGKELTRS